MTCFEFLNELQVAVEALLQRINDFSMLLLEVVQPELQQILLKRRDSRSFKHFLEILVLLMFFSDQQPLQMIHLLSESFELFEDLSDPREQCLREGLLRHLQNLSNVP